MSLRRQEEKTFPISFDLRIICNPHGKSQDFELTRSEIRHANIFFPEMLFWTSETENLFNAVSAGQLNPVQAMQRMGLIKGYPQYDFLYRQFQVIYKSGIKCIFLDYPKDHPQRKVREKIGELDPSDLWVRETDFIDGKVVIKKIRLMVETDEFIQRIREYTLAQAKFNEEREKYIVEGLSKTEEMIIKAGKYVKGVMFRGSIHAHGLQTGFIPRSETRVSYFTANEERIDPYNQLMLLYRRNKDETSEAVLAAAVQFTLAPFLGDFLASLSLQTEQSAIVYSYFASKLNGLTLMKLHQLMIRVSNISESELIEKIFNFFELEVPENGSAFYLLIEQLKIKLGIN